MGPMLACGGAPCGHASNASPCVLTVSVLFRLLAFHIWSCVDAQDEVQSLQMQISILQQQVRKLNHQVHSLKQQNVATRPVQRNLQACVDSPAGWVDSDPAGFACADYTASGWCTASGGYGSEWDVSWGNFDEYANMGVSAVEACCGCGGGKAGMTCGEWPTESIYGCFGGGEWLHLNTIANERGCSAACSTLEGYTSVCCFFSDTDGCYAKPEASAASSSGAYGKSVACSSVDEALPLCIGNAIAFNLGYGGCGTYASTNYEWCVSHAVNGTYAWQVCKECGECVEHAGVGPSTTTSWTASTATTKGTATSTVAALPLCSGDAATFDAGYGGCGTYAPGGTNHNYCSSDSVGEQLASQVCEGCGQCSQATHTSASATESTATTTATISATETTTTSLQFIVIGSLEFESTGTLDEVAKASALHLMIRFGVSEDDISVRTVSQNPVWRLQGFSTWKSDFEIVASVQAALQYQREALAMRDNPASAAAVMAVAFQEQGLVLKEESVTVALPEMNIVTITATSATTTGTTFTTSSTTITESTATNTSLTTTRTTATTTLTTTSETFTTALTPVPAPLPLVSTAVRFGVSLGFCHTAVLKSDGTVWTAGCGSYGRLADNSTLDRSVLVQVASDAQAVALGISHTAVLKSDGSIWTAGAGNAGKLADDTWQQRATFSQVVAEAQAVALGGDHTAVLKADSSVWTAGDNLYGQLADGSKSSRAVLVRVASGAQSISLSTYGTAVLKSDGSVWTCGTGSVGQLGDGSGEERHHLAQAATGAQAVAMGFLHSAVLKSDGSVWTAGYGSFGRLGTGNVGTRMTFVKVATGAQSIGVGTGITMMLKADGSIWTVGDGSKGCLADGGHADRFTFMPVASGVQAIAAFIEHIAVVKSDGTIWTAGESKYGRLADGNKGTNICELGNRAVLEQVFDVGVACGSATRHEAEFQSWDSVVAAARSSAWPGFSGLGYADFSNPKGSVLTWSIFSCSVARFMVTFRYSLEIGVPSLELVVNGVSSELRFLPTGAWTTWSYASRAVQLLNGTNTIQLRTTGSGGPSVDYLDLTEQAYVVHAVVVSGIQLVQVNDDPSLASEFADKIKEAIVIASRNSRTSTPVTASMIEVFWEPSSGLATFAILLPGLLAAQRLQALLQDLQPELDDLLLATLGSMTGIREAMLDGELVLTVSSVGAPAIVDSVESYAGAHESRLSVSEWWSVSGPCEVNGACVRSPGWPGEYSGDEACTMNSNFPDNSFLRAVQIDTEEVYDVVSINGQDYSATFLEAGIVPSTVSWSSDFLVSGGRGWELCAGTCPPGYHAEVEASGSITCSICDPGKFSVGQGESACEECSPGSFAEGAGSSECANCPAGRYCGASGADRCFACLPGRFSLGQGEPACLDCHPGTYASEPESSACRGCDTGRSLGVNGSSGPCAQCSPGRYADKEGQPACSYCRDPSSPDFSLWTTLVLVSGVWSVKPGAESQADCGCNREAWLADSGTCEICTTGMACPGMGALHIEPGYWSSAEQPSLIYRCSDAPEHLQCPGGVPGTCGAHRVNTSIACSRCESSMVATHGNECSPCEATSSLKLAAFCLMVIVMLAALYQFLASENRTTESSATATLTTAASQFIQAAQLVGLLGSMTVVWPPPVDAWLNWAKLLTFHFSAIDAGCVVPQSALITYSMKLIAMLILVTLMCAIHVVHVVIIHHRAFWERMSRLVSAIGAIFKAAFIAIAATIFIPFQCERHPGGIWTVHGAPEVACWDDDTGSEHNTMVLIALVASSIPVGFIAFVAWVLYQLPRRLYHADTEFLHQYKFLFFRFQPKAYWYVMVGLVRNLAAALVLVIGDQGQEILVLAVLMLPSVVLTSAFAPWRVWMANVTEVVVITGILFLLILAGILYRDADAGNIGVLCCGILIVMMLALGAAGCHAVFVNVRNRFRKTFSFFLCHSHTQGMGFTRLLKLKLSSYPRVLGQVYLNEEDSFQDLGSCFDSIRDSAVVLVICVPDVIRRPWSVGVLVVSHCHDISTTLLLSPSFEFPGANALHALAQSIPGLHELSPFGIGPDQVVQTLRGIQARPFIQLPTQMSMTCITTIVDQLTQEVHLELYISEQSDPSAEDSSRALTFWPRVGSPNVVLLVDHGNWEAVCTAFLVCRMLLVHALGQCAPHVLRPGETIPRDIPKALVMCSRGSLQNDTVAEALVTAARRGLAFLPVLIDESFEPPVVGEAGGGRVSHVGRATVNAGVLSDVQRSVFREISACFYPRESEKLLAVRLNRIVNFLERRVPVNDAEAALLASAQIAYHGQLLHQRGVKCIASFPGKYAAAWDAVTAHGHSMSVACVFLTGQAPRHSPQDPDDPQSPCWCHAIYGPRDYKRLGYITRLPSGLTLAERVAKTEQMANFGIVVIHPTDIEEDVSAKEEEANNNWKQSGYVASWGCEWFVEWMTNVDAAVALGQRLQVYFFAGQVGEGIVSWEDLPDTDIDLWDGVGMGGSQKGEVAYLIKKGYAFDMVDVNDFEEQFVCEARATTLQSMIRQSWRWPR